MKRMALSVRVLWIPALVLSMVCPGAAGAQSHHHHPFRPTTAPFPIIPNLGKLKHEVACNLGAQAYFNQGLTLLYGFNYDGSYASFREALGKDPNCAMAEWGMALALGANINIDTDTKRIHEAAGHIDNARNLTGASERDRDYIEALSHRYSHEANPDKTQLAVDYSIAMRGLCQKYWVKDHQDPDAATLYAESLMDLRPWDLWMPDGTPYPGTLEIVDILRSVIENPATADHVGAVHYHLHALEPSPRWREAAGDAEKLRTLVPASGHLVHMPSHIYLLQRDYEKAAQSNEDAIEQDVWYRDHVADDGYVGHYLSHNRHFLAVARSLQNRFGEAIEAARAAETEVKEHIGDEPGLEHYLTTPTLVLARFGRWDELIQAPKPDGKRRIAVAMWLWGQAVGYAGKGDHAKARMHQLEFWKAVQASGTLPWGNNPSRRILEVAELDLRARIAAAERDKTKEAEYLMRAAAAERKLSYDEPPPWIVVSAGRYPSQTEGD